MEDKLKKIVALSIMWFFAGLALMGVIYALSPVGKEHNVLQLSYVMMFPAIWAYVFFEEVL